MSALDDAKKLYAAHGLDFEADLINYLRHGFVFSTPDRLLLARPVNTARGIEWLTDHAEADAWFVKYAGGKDGLRWFIGRMPWHLPKLVWGRFIKGKDDDTLKIYRTERVQALINRSRLAA